MLWFVVVEGRVGMWPRGSPIYASCCHVQRKDLAMLRISFSLSLVLISAAVAGCAVADGATEGTNAAALAAPPAAPRAFVLSVQSRNAPVDIIKPDGAVDDCPRGEWCDFAYLEGTPLQIEQAWIFDRPNCELFLNWLYDCAGAGRDPVCHIVINSDLTVDSDWGIIRRCIAM